MRAPLIAIVLAVLGGMFLFASAFLGVTAIADWTMFGAGSVFCVGGGGFPRVVFGRMHQRDTQRVKPGGGRGC